MVRASSRVLYYGFIPPASVQAMFDEWANLTATVNARGEAAGVSAYATQLCGTRTGINNRWVFKDLQDMYIRVALGGLGVGIGVAGRVLLGATFNLIVALLATFTILAAIMCVIGSIVLIGWTLGSAECQFVMILSGFSVDYVVHLAHAYMESSHAARLDRVKDALRDLGVSVFWGMTTSVIASISLAMCYIQFFYKFGLFFLLTIVWAYLWAALFMMAVLATVGPQVTTKGQQALRVSESDEKEKVAV